MLGTSIVLQVISPFCLHSMNILLAQAQAEHSPYLLLLHSRSFQIPYTHLHKLALRAVPTFISNPVQISHHNNN